MRPGWSQTGMKIEIVNMFTWDRYENHKIFNLFPLTGNFLFQMAFVLIACVVPMSRLQPRPVWNVFVFTFIPVWIHPGLNSCRSEVMPVWSQLARSSRRNNDLRPVRVIFVPVSCKRSLVIKYPLVLFHQIPSIYRVSQKNVPFVVG
jgi:hypothetical protein